MRKLRRTAMFSKRKVNKIKRILQLKENNGLYNYYITQSSALTDEALRHKNLIIFHLESMKKEHNDFIDSKIKEIENV